MLSLIIGLASVGLSVWGLFRWWPEFVFFMKGFLPISFLLGGVVAVIAGLSSFGGGRTEGAAKPTEKN